MKKFLLSFMVSLLAFLPGMAENVTVAFIANGATYTGDATETNRTTIPDGAFTDKDITAGDITINMPKVNSSGSNVASNVAKWYASDVMHFRPNSGAKITKVVINASTAAYASALGTTCSTGKMTYVTKATYVTWEGSATEDFTITAAAQCRFTSIEVTYEPGGPKPAQAPVFSPAGGEVYAGTEITISAEDAVRIAYDITIDGVTESEMSATNPCKIVINKPTTITAWAYGSDENEVGPVTATYTIKEFNGIRFDIVTSADGVKAGDKVIVVGKSGENYYAAKNNTSGNVGAKLLANADASYVMFEQEDTDIAILTVEASSDDPTKFALKNGDKYLKQSSSTSTTYGTPAYYSAIKIADETNVATVNIASGRLLRIYTSTPDFRGYAETTNGSDIYLYRLYEAPVEKTAVVLSFGDTSLEEGAELTVGEDEIVEVSLDKEEAAADLVFTSVPADALSFNYDAGMLEVTALKAYDEVYFTVSLPEANYDANTLTSPKFKTVNSYIAPEAFVITPTPEDGKITITLGESVTFKSANASKIIVDLIGDETSDYDVENEEIEGDTYTFTPEAADLYEIQVWAVDSKGEKTEITAEVSVTVNKKPFTFAAITFFPEDGSEVEIGADVTVSCENATSIFTSTDGETYTETEGTEATVEVTEDMTIYAYAYNSDEDATSETVSATYTVIIPEIPVLTGHAEYQLVKAQSEIKAGETYIITKVSTDENGVTKAMGAISSNISAATDITVKDRELILNVPESVLEITLEESTYQDGYYDMAIKVEDSKKYLSADEVTETPKSNTNKLYLYDTTSDFSAANIALKDAETGEFTVEFFIPEGIEKVGKYLLFNNNNGTNPRFTPYVATHVNDNGAMEAGYENLRFFRKVNVEPVRLYNQHGMAYEREDEDFESDYFYFVADEGVNIYYRLIEDVASAATYAPARVAAETMDHEGETYNLYDNTDENEGKISLYADDEDHTRLYTGIQYFGEKDGVKSAVKSVNVGVWTGVSSINAESNGTAVWFNLQGVRVANPEKGTFIRVLNGKAEKLLK